MKAYESVAATLRGAGVDHLFGVLGDPTLRVVYEFVQRGGRYVSASHEAAAVMMAVGYGSVATAPAVAAITHGPGFTNAITAAIEARKGHRSVVILAGETAAADHDHPQRLRQAELATAADIDYRSPGSSAEIPAEIERALVDSVDAHCPVIVAIRQDLVEQDLVDPYVPESTSVVENVCRDDDALDRAAAMLLAAQRPLLVVGRGAVSCRDRIAELAKLRGAALATTLQARSIFDGQRANLGIFGSLSDQVAQLAISEADCIAFFGSSLNRLTTFYGELLNGKRVLAVGVGPDRNTTIPVEVELLGDCAGVIEQITERVVAAGLPASGFADLIESRPSLQESAPAGIFAQALLAIDKALPPNRIVVTDGGRFLSETYKWIRVNSPEKQITTVASGAVGLGIGAAIGAALGAPGECVAFITGDGGFAMSGLADLLTAIRLEIPILVVIVNDGAYGAEYVQLASAGLEPDISKFVWPSFSAMFAAIGVQTHLTRSPSQLNGAIGSFTWANGPFVIDHRVDPKDIPVGAHRR